MDYSDDNFHTFLWLDSVNCLTVNGTVTSLPVFIQNILNCVPKTSKAFTGLERHGGMWNNFIQITVVVFFFNCLHTKSLLVTQFLKPDTQTPEPHTKSAKSYTNYQPLTQ